MLISITDLIKKTINLYQKNFKIFAVHLLIFTLISIICLTNFNLLLINIFNNGFSIFSALFLLLTIVTLALLFLSIITLIKIFYKKYQNSKIEDIQKELKNNAHLILPTITVYIIFSILISLCLIPAFIIHSNSSLPIWFFLLFVFIGIILGIFLEILLKFSYFAVIIDEHKIIQSFKTSFHLVKRRWFSVFWRLFVSTLLFVIIFYLLQFILDILAEIINNNFISTSKTYLILNLSGSILSGLITIFFIPLIFLPAIILYEYLKKIPQNIKNKKYKKEITIDPPKL